MKLKSFIHLFLYVWAIGGSVCAAFATIPHLEQRGITRQLIVDDQPFLVLGGELHNSSSTSRAYLAPIWPKLVEQNLNTVLVAIPWDLIEPVEGTFDFGMLDHLVEDARRHQLRLVVLWFGSWKNGFSHYVPEWVKRDRARFPYARIAAGTPEVLSVFGEETAAADTKAFGRLMRHLRSIDEQQHTVVMVQVENEVGLHGDSRDRSADAEKMFRQPVAPELLAHLSAHRETLLPELAATWQSSGFKTEGTWTDVFGSGPAAEEVFMGWHYARYVDRVAAAGKAEYPLPLFVNAWIVQPSDKRPGDYPTGGPQSHMLDVWRAGAPHIDLLVPDIYRPDFAKVCAEFTRSNNTLFVPESRAGAMGAANAFLALGRFRSIGYSPFGIDDESAGSGPDPMAEAYALLHQLAPSILDHQTRDTISAVSLDADHPTEDIDLAGYRLTAGLLTDRPTNRVPERGYGLILATAPDEFLVAGRDLQIAFSTHPRSDETVALASVEEGTFKDGKWVPGRRLNGDEITLSINVPALVAAHQTGTGLRFPSGPPTIIRVKLFRFR
jgi:beta-galactosidase GanA